MTNLYSYKGQYPQELPNRIRLVNGLTKTDKNTFTTEDLSGAGYFPVAGKPSVDEKTHKISWDSSSLKWNVIELTEQEKNNIIIAEWANVRKKRDSMLERTDVIALKQLEVDGAVEEKMRIYRQKLRDIPQVFSNPYNIVWPSYTTTTVLPTEIQEQ